MPMTDYLNELHSINAHRHLPPEETPQGILHLVVLHRRTLTAMRLLNRATTLSLAL